MAKIEPLHDLLNKEIQLLVELIYLVEYIIDIT